MLATQAYTAFGSNTMLEADSRHGVLDPMSMSLGTGGIPLEGPSFEARAERKGRKPQSANKPLAPAKSVATASRAFFKGVKRAVAEASNLALTANLAKNSPGSETCQVGIAVLAVGHGLTDNKNGRVSKEEEQRAARRKPQAFLLQDGQIPVATMHRIFRAAVEGTREGSPPAEITTWHGVEQMEKWFARRDAERSMAYTYGGSRGSGSDQGEPSMLPDPRAYTDFPRDWGAGPKSPHLLHDAIPGPWFPPAEELRTKCPADISKWLREECQGGLDEEDVSKLMHCLTHPDWGIKNKEFLFALSDDDLRMMMMPIREQGLKNFIIQKCRLHRRREGLEEGGDARGDVRAAGVGRGADAAHSHACAPAAKVRKTGPGGK